MVRTITKKAAVITGMSLALTGMAQGAADQDMKALKAEGKTLIMSFAKSLKVELKKGMKAGGPVAAVAACNVKAPEVQKNISQNSNGWTIGRTSLKLRNRKNAPDAWEKNVLLRFEAAKRNGKNPKTLAYAQIVEQDGRKVFRMMKAIPTGGICMVCHGTPGGKVRKKLQELYPDDQATGFKPGDIRGAFTLSKPL